MNEPQAMPTVIDTRSIGEYRMKINFAEEQPMTDLGIIKRAAAEMINVFESLKKAGPGYGEKARLLSIAQTSVQTAVWAVQDALTPED